MEKCLTYPAESKDKPPQRKGPRQRPGRLLAYVPASIQMLHERKQ